MSEELLFEDVPSPQTRKVVFMIGRFQPPHLGHYKVINDMVNYVRKNNQDDSKSKLEFTPIVVIVRGKETSKDLARNPLSFDDIVKIMKASGKIDAKTKFIEANSAFDAFVQIRDSGYEPTVIFSGSDRGVDDTAPYKEMLDKYFLDDKDNKIDHTFVPVERNDASELDKISQHRILGMIEKNETVDSKIVSGSLARTAVKLDLHKAFSIITGLESKPKIAEIAYKKVERGIN